MRIVTVALVLAVLMSSGALQVVHGQQASPAAVTATVSPTATPFPNGHALLALMRKAITLHRSLRIASTSLSTWNGHWVLGVTWMDVGIVANTLREVDTTQRVRPNVSPLTISVWRRELLLAHGIAASRTPHTAWYCETVRGARVRNSLTPFQMKAPSITNLGPDSADGVAVWHLQAIGAEAPAWSAGSATVDLYISRADDTLVRLTLKTVTRLGGNNVHEQVTEDYSRYGKPVRVRLPAVCG